MLIVLYWSERRYRELVFKGIIFLLAIPSMAYTHISNYYSSIVCLNHTSTSIDIKKNKLYYGYLWPCYERIGIDACSVYILCWRVTIGTEQHVILCLHFNNIHAMWIWHAFPSLVSYNTSSTNFNEYIINKSIFHKTSLGFRVTWSFKVILYLCLILMKMNERITDS